MIQSHKKPTAGFWTAVALVAVLVGYPLSFGPACALVWRNPLAFRSLVARTYSPMRFLATDGPAPVREIVTRYVEFWAPKRVIREGSVFSNDTWSYGVLDELDACD